MDQAMASKWEEAQRASAFLERQLSELKTILEESQENLNAFARDNHISATSDGTTASDERLMRLEEEYAKARTDRMKKESDYQLAASDAPDAFENTNSPVMTSLRGKLAE